MGHVAFGPLVSDCGDVVDDAVVLATFWRDVTHRIRLNYPELSVDDVRDQLSVLLLDVHASACRRSAGMDRDTSDAQAISLVRDACSDVVRRSTGGARPRGATLAGRRWA